MNTGTWIVLGVIIAAAVAGIVSILVRLFSKTIPWKKFAVVPSGFEAIRYSIQPPHQVDEQILIDCLMKTIELLPQHVPGWTHEKVTKALSDIRILVRNSDSWLDEYGRKVAGLQNGKAIAVGANLAAFFHEAAHLAEERLNGGTDFSHASWETNGIRTAENFFHGWLETRLKS